MSLLIFRLFLSFLKNGLKLLADKALEIIPKYGRSEAQSWPSASGKNNNIWNTLQLILVLYFKMLSAALSRLVLICNFFEETFFCYLRAYLLACFYEEHLNPLMHNVVKWPNILLKSCGVNTARFLKYVWPFYNIMHQRVKFHISFLFSLKRFRTVETIPICKSRDDGTDMRFRNS